jgi:hypothetical protein
LARAHEQGLEDLPDLFQYAAIGLSTYEEFDAHPLWLASWRERRTSQQRFSNWVEQLPEHVWAALESSAQLMDSQA